MRATTVYREARDLALCLQHLGMERLFSRECERAGCKTRSSYAVRVVTVAGRELPRLLCVRHSARRLRRQEMVPAPSLRLRVACRRAGVCTRQFLELPGSATSRWFREADVELAGGAR